MEQSDKQRRFHDALFGRETKPQVYVCVRVWSDGCSCMVSLCVHRCPAGTFSYFLK